jgi:predicted regulator of Ras-like GTPase activity (Roadblock/LC7/MglB family)
MFSELLDRIIRNLDGIVGAAVMGMDGISIEGRMLDPSLNVESVAAEYTSVLRSSSSTSQNVGLGQLEELVVSTDQRVVVIRMITPEYFIFVLLQNRGNMGRVRFELKRAKYVLAKEFAV